MPNDKDSEIRRAVAFKGAIEALRMISSDAYTDMDEVVALVGALTEAFDELLGSSPATKEGDPAKLSDEEYEREFSEEDTRPVCNVCHQVLVHKNGLSKAGKPYSGWFCLKRDCKGTPVWD